MRQSRGEGESQAGVCIPATLHVLSISPSRSFNWLIASALAVDLMRERPGTGCANITGIDQVIDVTQNKRFSKSLTILGNIQDADTSTDTITQYLSSMRGKLFVEQKGYL